MDTEEHQRLQASRRKRKNARTSRSRWRTLGAVTSTEPMRYTAMEALTAGGSRSKCRNWTHQTDGVRRTASRYGRELLRVQTSETRSSTSTDLPRVAPCSHRTRQIVYAGSTEENIGECVYAHEQLIEVTKQGSKRERGEEESSSEAESGKDEGAFEKRGKVITTVTDLGSPNEDSIACNWSG
jgi:hypothetical protein